jgi:hypothetical protein
MYYLKLEIMKKNFYNQRTPQLLSWGTVKRSAAAICLAAVMLLAPVAVNAVEKTVNLASPVATSPIDTVNIAGNYIVLGVANTTYILNGSTSSYGIKVVANNVTVILDGVGNLYAPSTASSLWFTEDNATLKIKSGASRVGNASVSYNGIWVDSGKNLTIEEADDAVTGAQLTAYAGTDGAAIVAETGASITIASGKVLISNNGATTYPDVLLKTDAKFRISGGTVEYYANTNSVFDLAAGAIVNITGGNIYRGAFTPTQIFKLADNTSEVRITGGSLNTSTYTLFNVSTHAAFNGGTDTVKVVKVNGPLPAAIGDINGGYGKNGLDGVDPLYIWLPESAETVKVRGAGANGIDYIGTITGTWAANNREVTLAPQGTPGSTNNPGLNPAGNPPGWNNGAGIANVRYSGETYELTFNFVAIGDDRKVAITVTGDVKDYITVPDTIILRANQPQLIVPYTVKPLPADKEGQLKGSISATIGGAGTAEPTDGYWFLNPLVDPQGDKYPKNLTIEYNPRTTLYGGEVTLTPVNGDKRIYWYSIDGGKTWAQVNKQNSKTIVKIPAGAEYLYIKEPGSSFYIAFELDTNGNINAPVGTRRQVVIPEVAGIETIPSAGWHYAVSRQDFYITVTPTSPIPAGKELDVRTDRDNLSKEEDRIIEAVGDGSYKVTIKGIQQAVNISILFADGTVAIDGSNVWGANGQLYITAASAGIANIYALTGSLVKSLALTAGETAATSLPAGIYVVTLGGNTYKAVVK